METNHLTDTVGEKNNIYMRTSSNNMLCLVEYEPLPENVQSELEKTLKVAI